ncbi:hypothetical protein [Olleya sp. R77988]|uniref:hypothetical protein n=1 Tax=Olleya sp. R77988 TaxID=3093875 RepID=UPI0037C8683C
MKLNIIGNNNNETALISKYKYNKLHKTQLTIKEEVTLFQNRMKKEGYINNDLISIITQRDSTYTAKIHLKNKIDFIHIYIDSIIYSEKYFSKLNLPKIKDNYFKLPYNTLENKLTEYNQIISSFGYPFSSLKLTEIKEKSKTSLSAKLSIDIPKSIRKLDKIIIKGYEKFPKSYLKRYLKIRPTKIFNLVSINKKAISLSNLSFAKQNKEAEVLFSKDSTHLYLYLEKKSSNSFDGFIGFATNETSNKIEFNGYLNLLLVNNLNYGESLYLDYKSDQNEQKNFNLTANLPYIFGSPVGIEASLNILKKDSTYINTKQKASLFFQINDKNSFYGGIESTISSDLTSNDNLNNIVDFNSNFYTFRYQYLKRQNEEKLFQIKTSLNAEFGIGKRKTNLTSTEQSIININGHHIFNLNKKNSIYTKGLIQIISSDNYLENEFAPFGGVNTLRGFSENSLTANSLYILNSEYRYKLSNNLFVNSVIDVANFKNDLLNQKENLFGFGFGFGALTKGGLLRFIYANGKKENSSFKLSNSRIHLSLTSIF